MTDTPEGDPICDLYGDCEPFEHEAHERIAMCQHCGGTRYRDYPTFGNWGVWDDGTDAWLERVRNLPQP